MQEQYNGLIEVFKSIKKEGFYGTLSFQFRDGEVQVVRKEQTIKASEIFPSPTSGKTA